MPKQVVREGVYSLYYPEKPSCPLVLSLPHSGQGIPATMQAILKKPCPPLANMDWHLEKLYAFLPELEIPLLQAHFSRYVIDVNRELKAPFLGNYRAAPIALENTFGTALYEHLPDEAAIQERIANYYLPYHQALAGLLATTVEHFGCAYLLDLHSFYIQSERDICLGNRHHQTSSADFLQTWARAFREQGFSVEENKALIGGYITRHYANLPQIQTLQIELRYPAYLEQRTWGEEECQTWESPKFYATQARLQQVFEQVLEILQGKTF